MFLLAFCREQKKTGSKMPEANYLLSVSWGYIKVCSVYLAEEFCVCLWRGGDIAVFFKGFLQRALKHSVELLQRAILRRLCTCVCMSELDRTGCAGSGVGVDSLGERGGSQLDHKSLPQ